jgi:hypothetical protein
MATPNIDSEIVKMIAADTDTSAETVSRMFAETWAKYSEDAKIMDYLSVLVARGVRDNVLRWKQEVH